DGRAEVARQALDPARDVDRIADHPVLAALVRPEPAGDNLAGVDPDPDPELGQPVAPEALVQDGQTRDHGERRPYRARRIVGMGHRRAEHRHDAVTRELADDPSLRLDRGRHLREELVHEPHEHDRRETLGDGREPAHVLEEDRHLAPLAAQSRVAGEHGRGDVARHEAAERILDALALGEACDHLVERASQEPDLVLPPQRDALGEIPGEHALHRARELLQGRRDPGRDDARDEERRRQRGGAEEREALRQVDERPERGIVRRLHEDVERPRQLRFDRDRDREEARVAHADEEGRARPVASSARGASPTGTAAARSSGAQLDARTRRELTNEMCVPVAAPSWRAVSSSMAEPATRYPIGSGANTGVATACTRTPPTSVTATAGRPDSITRATGATSTTGCPTSAAPPAAASKRPRSSAIHSSSTPRRSRWFTATDSSVSGS